MQKTQRQTHNPLASLQQNRARSEMAQCLALQQRQRVPDQLVGATPSPLPVVVERGREVSSYTFRRKCLRLHAGLDGLPVKNKAQRNERSRTLMVRFYSPPATNVSSFTRRTQLWRSHATVTIRGRNTGQTLAVASVDKRGCWG